MQIKTSSEPLTDKILLEDYTLLKDTLIIYISTYVYQVCRRSCIIHLFTGGNESVYLDIDRVTKSVDLLLYFSDTGKAINQPFQAYTIEELFGFLNIIKNHDLKPSKPLSKPNSSLD